jgi:hypothetical protein
MRDSVDSLARPVRCGAAAVVVAALLLGCGGGADEGPQRFHVSGSVKFNGQPVPAGTVYLEPDTEQGNSGPAGSAPIDGGRYNTAAGKGTVGGPHLIRVDGFDGKATADKPFGDPLFVPFTIENDLPKSDTTLDLEVPASAAEGLQVPSEPV